MRGKESARGEGKTRTKISDPGLFKVSRMWASKSLYKEIRNLPNMF
jgi:hypothetical protein